MIFQFYSESNVPFLEISVLLLLFLLALNLPVLSKVKALINLNGIFISLLFFSLGSLAVVSTNDKVKNEYFFDDEVHTYQLYINQPVIEKTNSVKLSVDVIAKDNFKTIGKSLIYLEKTEQAKQLNYGDVLLIKGKFNPIKNNGNPEAFNYKDYLYKTHVYHQTYLKQNQWIKVGNEANTIFNFTYSIRNYFSSLIEQSDLASKNKDVLKALLLGQKEDLDRDTLRTYSSAGAMHVLAVSGLHVGIIMLILMFVFKPLKKLKFGKNSYVILIVFCLWFYAFLTGLSPSVLRSALMFSFVVIGKEMQRETSIYQSILVSAFILLIINPLVIFKVGFQLSYLAVLGIVYLQPKIYNLVYIKSRFFDYLWKISSVSIAAQIATFPLGLFYFHQFPNYFFISNLVVIPLAGLILGFGLAYFALFSVPIINTVVLKILDYLLTFLNFCVEKVESMPYSILWGISITWYETFLIYIIVILFVFAFTKRQSKLMLMSMVFSILMLNLFLYNSYKYSHQNQLIVYNVKNEIAFDIFYGKENYFISSDSLYHDDNQMLFNVKHNWFKIRQSEKPYQFVSLDEINQPIFKINNQTLSVISGDSPKYITDFIIIGDVKNIDVMYLSQLRENKSTLIVSGKCPAKTRFYIEKNYPENLIYNLNESGAFTFSF